MPPQHYILATLAADFLLVGRQTTPEQRERVRQLSAGAFGRMVICPQAGKRDANGRTPLVYEGDEARGGPRGRLHRSIVSFSPETKVGWVVWLVLLNDVLMAERTRSFLQKSSYCVTLIFLLKWRAVQPLGRPSYDQQYSTRAGLPWRPSGQCMQIETVYYMVDYTSVSYWNFWSVRLLWIPAPEYKPDPQVRPTPFLTAPSGVP
jgi:hypothetical protein